MMYPVAFHLANVWNVDTSSVTINYRFFDDWQKWHMILFRSRTEQQAESLACCGLRAANRQKAGTQSVY